MNRYFIKVMSIVLLIALLLVQIKADVIAYPKETEVLYLFDSENIDLSKIEAKSTYPGSLTIATESKLTVEDKMPGGNQNAPFINYVLPGSNVTMRTMLRSTQKTVYLEKTADPVNIDNTVLKFSDNRTGGNSGMIFSLEQPLTGITVIEMDVMHQGAGFKIFADTNKNFGTTLMADALDADSKWIYPDNPSPELLTRDDLAFLNQVPVPGITVTNGGTVFTPENLSAGSLEKGKWYKLRIIADTDKKLFRIMTVDDDSVDLVLDYKKLESTSLPAWYKDTIESGIKHFGIYTTVGLGANGVYVDNVKIFKDNKEVKVKRSQIKDSTVEDFSAAMKDLVDITWDSATLATIFGDGMNTASNYPRLLKLADGTLLCAHGGIDPYGSGKSVCRVSQSTDGGKTWSLLSVATFGVGRAGNGQMIQLQNGDVLMAYRDIIYNNNNVAIDCSLKVSKSTDNGKTWEMLSEIDHNTEGLWEPHMLMKSNGEIMVFYADESVKPQVISIKTSKDGGKTWTGKRIVSQNPASRDGMPVAEFLGDDNNIIVAIEASDEAPLHPFVIKYVVSNDGGITWSESKVAYRPALPGKRAAAPYIVRIPTTGELLISFQTDEDMSATGSNTVEMKIVASKDNGKTWSMTSIPFDLSDGSWGQWNAMYTLEDGTVIAASAIKYADEKFQTARIIKGTVNQNNKE